MYVNILHLYVWYISVCLSVCLYLCVCVSVSMCMCMYLYTYLYKCNSIPAHLHLILIAEICPFPLASPYFQEVPREVSNLQMGDNVIYTCAVLAQPQSNLTIKWLKDGVVISEPDSRVNVSFSLSENPITVSGNSTLSISPVELNDAGVYTCQAVSNNGTSQYNFTQKVLGELWKCCVSIQF